MPDVKWVSSKRQISTIGRLCSIFSRMALRQQCQDINWIFLQCPLDVSEADLQKRLHVAPTCSSLVAKGVGLGKHPAPPLFAQPPQAHTPDPRSAHAELQCEAIFGSV